MPLTIEPDGAVTLTLAGRVVLRHASHAPCLAVGRGEERMAMYRGNFDISDTVLERAPLHDMEVAGAQLNFRERPGGPVRIAFELFEREGHARLVLREADPTLDRFWLRLHAEPDEAVWGCGEQMSYFDLRGRKFPLWTSEPGVGRDKSTAITQQADAEGHAGGDYFTTNYPQPTFLTSRRLAVHVETTAYSVFDFCDPDCHELELWAMPGSLEFWAADTLIDLVAAMSKKFGRPPALPEWATTGLIVGLKHGQKSFETLERYVAAGVKVSAVWCEDWAGIRTTSFGTRLFWDWRANAARYPDLAGTIKALGARDIRFMGYVNPYLCLDGALFPEAERLGHLARNAAGETYRVDFGEFDCGVVDFSSSEACEWFAERVIGREMIDLGMAGWMADFGEYLPVDTVLASGEPARRMHNAWPTLWAHVNADAVRRAGRTGDIVFFMRAGFTGVQSHCPLLWAGDQSVDFSRHDGLGTVITAALSSGLLGNPYHHSDIGGYTSLFGNVRTLELLQRWAEMAAFTPVMRTHEGNRPAENLQFHDSTQAMAALARAVRVHDALGPYLRALVDEAVATGLPMQRPLILHFPGEARLRGVHDHFLLGPDLLVAPVCAAGATEWRVVLPGGVNWVHLWTGAAHAGGGTVTVPAPIGNPPVFRRADSRFAPLFDQMTGT